MKINSLLNRLQELERQHGPDIEVDVALIHPEDGFCSKAIESVEFLDECEPPGVLVMGGAIEYADGIEIPTEEELLEQERQHHVKCIKEICGDEPNLLRGQEWHAHLILAQIATDRLRLLEAESHHLATLARILEEREAAEAEARP